MSTSKATARPWVLGSNGAIMGSDGSAIGVVATDANAALIVRAVNSHEAMVCLLDAVEQWSGADPMVKGECFREVCERAAQARAALALAEQG